MALNLFPCLFKIRSIWGSRVGQLVGEGDVLALEGDLGSGKTAFVRGLAKGLLVPDGYAVTSPTYALIHTYPGRLTLFHVDLYRISGEDDAENIGLFEFLGKEGVCAVEWAQRPFTRPVAKSPDPSVPDKGKTKADHFHDSRPCFGTRPFEPHPRIRVTSNWSFSK